MRIGLFEWLIILAIVLVIFGGTQIPKLVKALKNAKKDLTKKESEEVKDE